MANFHDLPAELRILIWQYSHPGPRDIVVSWDGIDFASNLSPPTVAHVCHESREEALKHFSLIFGRPDRPGYILFDNSMDTLFVTDEVDYQLTTSDRSFINNLKHFRFTNVMAQKCTS
ncbi:hypothetical protein M409DRAFT_23637 [Zasmidium cellare ATCC 36951]|uniref:2EXR domain-containing protein n=1 Tax=Zasmidium cellare ATCC 36951 TaxID=1080233 RepID=A0A6A6CFI4_ZASCE|nr:uncharacterized protein M409DRAFT_23637 [Zasmidium cellare ATCC 36951]KAF2165905.1 hypothetical protein M409DRAFT_23637 [Zasmidium cellare ATCC 36951]